MGFPTTVDELQDAGYQFQGEGECKSCGARLEWWSTPKGKKIPMNWRTAKPHWATCPHADQHRTSEVRHNKPVSNGGSLDLAKLREQARGCHCAVCKQITGVG